MTMRWPACLVVSWLLTTAVAGAETLEGRVVLTPLQSQRGVGLKIPAYPGMLGSVPNANTESRDGDVRDVVLYMVRRGDADAPVTARSEVKGQRAEDTSPPSDSKSSVSLAARKQSVRHALVQEGQRFSPHVLGIPVGATVDFPNRDPVFHNVFSYSKTRRFDLGKYGKGKSKSVTFEEPGIVKIFCEIHSDMTAFIFVADTPYVTQPDETGAFAFTHVPAGVYELSMWHPERGPISQEVRVGGRPTTVELDF